MTKKSQHPAESAFSYFAPFSRKRQYLYTHISLQGFFPHFVSKTKTFQYLVDEK